MNARSPVLLTSSVIAYDAGVSLKDPSERVRLTLESVGQWLRIDPLLPIVLCDGSNFDFSPLIRKRFPGATIECLRFENDQEKVRLHGRGYGEGEIVRYALDHSRLITAAGSFAKCSAKLWVANFSECTVHWNGQMRLKAVFNDVFSPWRETRLAYIDTRFYIASLENYRRHFEYAHHQIRAAEGHGLEEAFRDVFLQNELRHALLPVYPIICGVGGGTGRPYRTPLKRRIKEWLRLKLVITNPSFKHYF